MRCLNTNTPRFVRPTGMSYQLCSLSNTNAYILLLFAFTERAISSTECLVQNYILHDSRITCSKDRNVRQALRSLYNKDGKDYYSRGIISRWRSSVNRSLSANEQYTFAEICDAMDEYIQSDLNLFRESIRKEIREVYPDDADYFGEFALAICFNGMAIRMLQLHIHKYSRDTVYVLSSDAKQGTQAIASGHKITYEPLEEIQLCLMRIYDFLVPASNSYKVNTEEVETISSNIFQKLMDVESFKEAIHASGLDKPIEYK